MSSEPDLATRVAELEKLVGRQKGSGRTGGLLGKLGYLLLAALLTLNAWMTWKSFSSLAANRIEHHFWVLCHGGATDEQRRHAFTELVKAGNREWRSARLSHLHLRRGDFDGVQLDQADMEGCDFTLSTMVGASFRGANVQMGKLVDVDLS
ncbi:MAG: pentapeptide repeat-containing protein, partial [Planctomycetota bacterium]